jgi:hypothetical protein
MTAKKTANRNCLIPNEGGFRPAGSVVFNELAIRVVPLRLLRIEAQLSKSSRFLRVHSGRKIDFL